MDPDRSAQLAPFALIALPLTGLGALLGLVAGSWAATAISLSLAALAAVAWAARPG